MGKYDNAYATTAEGLDNPPPDKETPEYELIGLEWMNLTEREIHIFKLAWRMGYLKGIFSQVKP